MGESDFPKSTGDILYASEANSFGRFGVLSLANAGSTNNTSHTAYAKFVSGNITGMSGGAIVSGKVITTLKDDSSEFSEAVLMVSGANTGIWYGGMHVPLAGVSYWFPSWSNTIPPVALMRAGDGAAVGVSGTVNEWLRISDDEIEVSVAHKTLTAGGTGNISGCSANFKYLLGDVSRW